MIPNQATASVFRTSTFRRTLGVTGAGAYQPSVVALHRALCSKLPTPQRDADCIWFSDTLYDGHPYYDANRVLAGFVLRGGSTRATYHGKPAYMIYSCFVFNNARASPGRFWPNYVNQDDDLETLTTF